MTPRATACRPPEPIHAADVLPMSPNAVTHVSGPYTWPGDAVRRDFSIDHQHLWNTGSPACAGDDGRVCGETTLFGGTKTSPHSPTSFSHSSSVNTATPCFFASASFEPAPGPATT